MKSNESRSFDQQPFISIIIPCYNDAEYIEDAVYSAINQTYLNKEVIIINDGSNQTTTEVLNKLEFRVDLLITQENKGQSAARNAGILATKGEYIFFLDSDDFMEPTLCEKAIAVARKNKEVKIVSCYSRRFGIKNQEDIFKPKGGDLSDFLLENYALGTSLFIKQDLLDAGLYDETMTKGFEDWELAIRVLKKGGYAHIITEPLYNYRKRKCSTSTKANKIKYELQEYIFLKHKDLYIIHYEKFIKHLLLKTDMEEKEKIKNTQRKEFLIGKAVLSPFRLLKTLF